MNFIAAIILIFILLPPIEPGAKAKYESLRHVWNGGSHLLPRFNFPRMAEIPFIVMTDRKTKFAGQTFTRLTVIRRVTRKTIWCRCSCGVEKEIVCNHVFSGRVKSCGCIKQSEEHRALLRFHGHKSQPAWENAHGGFMRVFRNYKNNAASRSILFKLNEAEVRAITSSHCYFCGCPPRKATKSCNARVGMLYHYNGIDRLDNSKGYTLNNSVPCCDVCNRAKSNRTELEMAAWISRIINFNSKCKRYQ